MEDSGGSDAGEAIPAAAPSLVMELSPAKQEFQAKQVGQTSCTPFYGKGETPSSGLVSCGDKAMLKQAKPAYMVCDSSRCEPYGFPAGPCSTPPAICTPGVQDNAPTASAFPEPKIQHPASSRVQPRTPPAGPFAWNKVQFVPLGKLDSDTYMAHDGTSMEPAKEAVLSNIAKLDKGLVAKLMGRRISFPFLIEELKRRWYQFGEFEVITVAPNSFICLFQSVEARDAVLMSGPWIIAGSLIGMDKWSSNFSPNSIQGLHSPVWIRLPQLPLLYWDQENINRIANMLGDPLWMDSHTSTWGKSSFARICVRIDLSKRLVPGIWINGLHGRFFQRVEYEGISNLCFACGFLGHNAEKCSHKGPALATPRPSPPLQASPNQHSSSSPSQPSAEDARLGPHGLENKEDSFGAWNLVTRRKKSKAKTIPKQDTKPPKSPSPPIQFTANKEKMLEEVSNRILYLRKQPPRVSQAHFSKEIMQLGPIATSPRKRKKTATVITGGDLVPSSA